VDDVEGGLDAALQDDVGLPVVLGDVGLDVDVLWGFDDLLQQLLVDAHGSMWHESWS
jgi:hypothetical protein